MTRILITAAVLTLFATSAYAQREGGAFFGPFSSGNSSGGNFGSVVAPERPDTVTSFRELR
jgi:hypothetical protein